MACDPRSDTAVHGSHAAGVGAGEPRTPTTSRRVEGAPAAPTADGDGPDLLDRAVEAVEELAEFSAGGAARDRGAVAPSGLQGATGHGRVVAGRVGPRLGRKCGISFSG